MKKLESVINKKERVIIGIMSGTSLDGIDVSISKISKFGKETKISLIDFTEYKYDESIKKNLLNLVNNKGDVSDVCFFNSELGRIYGKCALDIMEKNNLTADDVDLICSHGQTLFHMPEKGATLQIGDGNIIAGITGVITVSDFRMGDIAAGGSGAPLAPYFDYLMLSSEQEDRIILNIGGISNFTTLYKNGTEDEVCASDCGPGNMLIDRAMGILTNEEKSFDNDGATALSGNVNETVIEYIFSLDHFVKAPLPKSTGRELYNEEFIQKVIKYAKDMGVGFEDIIASITCYTAKAIEYNIRNYCAKKNYVIYVGGGGAYNKTLMKMIEAETQCIVKKVDKLDINADAKEAVVFSVFGNELFSDRHNTLKNSTNAQNYARMGKISLPYVT